LQGEGDGEFDEECLVHRSKLKWDLIEEFKEHSSLQKKEKSLELLALMVSLRKGRE